MATEINTTLLKITSSAFEEEGMIPSRFTCEGENISPALVIENIPAGARSLAIIMEDPDAPGGTFDHWLVWNLPAKNMIEENTKAGTAGKNGFGKNGYGGPCPPSGTHRYFIRVYALDVEPDLMSGSDKDSLLEAIDDHIMAMGELMGKYRKVQEGIE